MSKKSREKRKQSEAEWLELCEKIEAETKPKKHFIDTFVESAETIDAYVGLNSVSVVGQIQSLRSLLS